MGQTPILSLYPARFRRALYWPGRKWAGLKTCSTLIKMKWAIKGFNKNRKQTFENNIMYNLIINDNVNRDY